MPRKDGIKTGKPGGQLKNTNAVKHDCYIRKYDGRTREARAVQQVEAELAEALGGDPTPQEVLLIQRCAVKALKCAQAEAVLIETNGSTPQSLSERYLKWARELRADLMTLGLERCARPVQDLESYLQTKRTKKGS